jgi:hypothetical protein
MADALDRSAELAERHADSLGLGGQRRLAVLELKRAERAREAAMTGSALALRLARGNGRALGVGAWVVTAPL